MKKEIKDLNVLIKEIINNYIIQTKNLKEEKTLVILITGHIGVGKNYISKELSNSLLDLGFDVRLSSFSNELKRIVLKLFGLFKDGTHINRSFYNLENIKEFRKYFFEYLINYSNKENEVIKEILNKVIQEDLGELIKQADELLRETQNYKKVARFILQKIGTEIIRENIDENFWIKKHFINNFINCKNTPNFIIVPDLRFPNELEFYKNKKYLEFIKSLNLQNSNIYTFNNKIETISIRVKVSNIKTILKRFNYSISLQDYLNFLNHKSEKYIDFLNVDFEFIND